MIDEIRQTVEQQVQNLDTAEQALTVLELAGEDVTEARARFEEIAAKLRRYQDAIEAVVNTR